jgi:Carboxypeptidase regulatory-like domain/TonB dependent receptor/TonB-dependent Receptor Plug Domain
MMRYTPACLRSLLVLAIFTSFSVRLLQAQVDTGSISGTVTDPSGAVVNGAKVTLTNEGTAATLSTTTGNDGGYKFSPVRIGNYKIDTSATGFKTDSTAHVAVDVSSNVLVNFKLTPGNVTETVEVTSEAPLLQTQDASVGQVVNQRSVNDLPLNGRNFTFLAQLAAGVNTPQADTRGNAASGAFSANGLRPAQNNYMLDGIDNNSDTVDFLNGTNYVVLPPVDAVQEFKVETSGFSAEYGRSAGAVLNATIKSGTNDYHGSAWEFFRNDKLDAADYFEDAGGIPKGELRQNQFGVTFGGPVIKNKMFFFGDYEGFRRVQGTIQTGTVPTVADNASGFSDLSDLITQTGNIADCAATGARCDDLGRVIPNGTILDPASTRAVTAGSADPITGLTATASGFVRDPFSYSSALGGSVFGTGACPANTINFSGQITACSLNNMDPARLDPNAIKLLQLFPSPTTGGIANNFASSRPLYEHRNAFDARLDVNFTQKDQLFFRVSYVDDPQFIPGLFGGVADGGAFQQGIQTAKAQQAALVYTHVFSPSTVNVARVGFNHLHTTRTGPDGADSSDIPSQFGIAGIPQGSLNGGLPAITFDGLSTLGSNNFLPSDELSQTLQVTDDFTKIYGKHSFKMGIEYQHIRFSTLQPAWSRGQFQFTGEYNDISKNNGQNLGIAQFLLTPSATTGGANGVSNVGGPDGVYASNISTTDDGKNYFATYFQDDWKISSKLTLNLGLRWDYFGLIYERHGKQANWVPYGAPSGSPMFLLPGGTDPSTLSASFTNQLAADNIALKIGGYGLGLGRPQKNNFAPRFGFAYQVTPKLVARGGLGLFYNAFENQGYGPNDGENYPFVYNFSWFSTNDYTPLGSNPAANPNPWTGCPTAGPGGVATLSSGFSCIPLSPAAVNASGLGLQGLQFAFKTPYTLGGNFTLQYQIQPSLTVQAGYVTTQGRHLQTGIGANNVQEILPAGAATNTFIPFAGFGGGSYQATVGSSSYNGLQTKVEKQFSDGLNFLATYTWSKTFSDANDLLNGGNVGGYRAPSIPGFGIGRDRGLADFDIRNVVHLSGGYLLPIGKGKRFMGSASKYEEAVFGGWSINAIATLQGGQPITLSCPTATTAGTNCIDLTVPGQSQKLGLHTDTNGKLSWFGNPGAFTQPCVMGGTAASGVVTGLAPIPNSPSGCVPLDGVAALGGGPSTSVSPGFRRLDFSLFKGFKLSERFSLQFRAEFFNLFNHPNFNAPGFGGNGVVAISNSGNYTNPNFGEIGSTRDAPYDPRQIQFALKLYF